MISAPAIPEIMEIYALSQAGNTEQVEQALVDYAPVFSRILWLSLLVVFIGSLLGLFFISVFYGKAWALALNKRISSSFVIKYFLFNLLWFLAWFLLLVFVLLVLKAAAASLALLLAMLIFIYADPVMRCLFDEKRSVKHNFSSLFRVAVRFRWFIFFIITAFLLGILLMMVLSLFQSFNFAFAALSIAFTLIFLGWMRNYSISLANGIHKAR
ncbi:hypothetical protein JXB28_01510 [Candidatus Woesearchaeota archaeon]|nr:hypothetical protein [Candidatus Woesearchaeota archaeon]